MKVLQISFGDSFRGVEKLELDWFCHMPSDISFDFLVSSHHTFASYESLIQKKGGEVYSLDITPNSFFHKIKYFRRLFQFFRKHHYSIIHINSSAFLSSFMVVLLARITGQKKIIVHSHNDNSLKNNFKRKKIFFSILNPLYRSLTNVHLSCSKMAGYSLFFRKYVDSNQVTILKNGLDIDTYRFHKTTRNTIRKKYHLEDKIVYGHIGGFVYEKNHLKLLEIFAHIHQLNSNSVLFCIGEGELKEEIQLKIKELQLEDSVFLLGFLEDASSYFNAMDVFLFPSIYEGFGMVSIEAQTNGLPTFCSDSIPSDVNISPFYHSFSLQEDASKIASYIVSSYDDLNRSKAYLYTIKSGYDIKKSSLELEKIYRMVSHE